MGICCPILLLWRLRSWGAFQRMLFLGSPSLSSFIFVMASIAPFTAGGAGVGAVAFSFAFPAWLTCDSSPLALYLRLRHGKRPGMDKIEIPQVPV
jgi:hypothetical protein